MNELLYYELLVGFPVTEWCTRLPLPAGVYVGERTKASSYSLQLTQCSERVWSETDEGVRYVKDRLSWDRPVDMEEFFWIKLSAKKLER